MTSQSDNTVTVTHAAERSRYEIAVDERLVGFAGYHTRGDRVVITHTEIDAALQGRGLAGELTRCALDDIRARDLFVTPLCSYTASYIRTHPEYVDLLDENQRAGG